MSTNPYLVRLECEVARAAVAAGRRADLIDQAVKATLVKSAGLWWAQQPCSDNLIGVERQASWVHPGVLSAVRAEFRRLEREHGMV